MFVLGINGGFRQGYQDVSATLIKNGAISYAIEEERLNRIKHSPGQLPEKSIQWILKQENISINDIDLVVSHGSSFGEEFENDLKKYFNRYFKKCPPILRAHHHTAHAASAYYASGFDESMILTVDNSGDGVSTQTAIGKNGKIKVLDQWKRPQSLGLFYSIMTQFCGFRKDTDEYKLMGLSAYGDSTRYDLKKILSISKGSYELDESYLSFVKKGQAQPHQQKALFSDKLIKLLNLEPRTPYEEITRDYKNLAASAQATLEEALIELIKNLYEKTKIKNLCLAGGVALNCLANQKLAQLDFIENLYIQPASSDAGISLGAAYLGSLELGQTPKPMKSVYLGSKFSDADILKDLKSCQVPFKKIEDPSTVAAQKISEDKIVAWFQGSMEFGPRALGARSILANPFNKNMKDLINSKIKFRESFRPFGASLLLEDKQDILDSPLKELPYMTVTAQVKEKYQKELQSITHEDKTTRAQTLKEKQNPLYWNLLKEFKKKMGKGIVINTSFNRNQEPIVHTTKEALSTFYGSGIDALIIGHFLLEK